MTERRSDQGMAVWLGLREEDEPAVQEALVASTPTEKLAQLGTELLRQDEVDNLLNDPLASERAGITEPQRIVTSMLRGLDGVHRTSYRQVAMELGIAPSTARRRAITGGQKAHTAIFGK